MRKRWKTNKLRFQFKSSTTCDTCYLVKSEQRSKFEWRIFELVIEGTRKQEKITWINKCYKWIWRDSLKFHDRFRICCKSETRVVVERWRMKEWKAKRECGKRERRGKRKSSNWITNNWIKNNWINHNRIVKFGRGWKKRKGGKWKGKEKKWGGGSWKWRQRISILRKVKGKWRESEGKAKGKREGMKKEGQRKQGEK